MKKILITIISILVLTGCKNRDQQEAYLKSLYPEVVQISRDSFLTVDTKGNIHLICDNTGDTVIIEYREIELVLDREFTKSDIEKSVR
jgi:hypothetical protein